METKHKTCLFQKLNVHVIFVWVVFVLSLNVSVNNCNEMLSDNQVHTNGTDEPPVISTLHSIITNVDEKSTTQDTHLHQKTQEDHNFPPAIIVVVQDGQGSQSDCNETISYSYSEKDKGRWCYIQ